MIVFTSFSYNGIQIFQSGNTINYFEKGIAVKKKYTIDDLIIEAPESKTKEKGQKSKKIYIAIALIGLFAIGGVLLNKMTTKSAIEIDSSEELAASPSGKDIIQGSVLADSKDNRLLNQIVLLEEETNTSNDELLLASADLTSQETPSSSQMQTSTPSAVEELQPQNIETRSPEPATVKPQPSVAETDKEGKKEPEARTDSAIQATKGTAQISKETAAGTETKEALSRKQEISSEKKEQKEEKIPDILASPKASTVEKKPAIDMTAAETTKKEEKAEKETTKKIAAKKVERKAENKSSAKSDGASVYFIQVGAFNREPDTKFISKIKDSGFDYTVVKSGKTRRVRVGPYSSLKSAKSVTDKVKRVIGINGLIVKSATKAAPVKKAEKKSTVAAAESQEKISSKQKKTDSTAEKKVTQKTESAPEATQKKTVTSAETIKKTKVKPKKTSSKADPLNFF